MTLPNFLIVGAAKSGTTSLFEYLIQHPEIYDPVIKEPGFLLKDNRFSHIKNWSEYQHLFRNSDKYKAIGEGSVSYMADPDNPRIVKERLGENVKIIILLRNPIDMSYSLWKHLKRDMHEDLPYFEALKAWEGRKSDKEFMNSVLAMDWDYEGRAKYYEQVKRYIENFKEVKVLIFEEFMQDMNKYYNELCEFLGIAPFHEVNFTPQNTAFEPKSKSLQKLLIQRSPFKEFVKKFLPHQKLVAFKYFIQSFNQNPDNTPKLSIEERKKLVAIFKEDVLLLEQLLGKDLKTLWKDFS